MHTNARSVTSVKSLTLTVIRCCATQRRRRGYGSRALVPVTNCPADTAMSQTCGETINLLPTLSNSVKGSVQTIRRPTQLIAFAPSALMRLTLYAETGNIKQSINKSNWCNLLPGILNSQTYDLATNSIWEVINIYPLINNDNN